MKLSLLLAAPFQPPLPPQTQVPLAWHGGRAIAAQSLAQMGQRRDILHVLFTKSSASSSSLLPPANGISFSFAVWVLTKCRPAATFFPPGEIGEPECSLLVDICPVLYLVFFNYYFCVTSLWSYTISSANWITSTYPQAVHHYQLLASLLSLCHHQVCQAHSLLLPH